MENPVSVLSYGPPGAGKSAFGVSSFWDYQKRELVEGETGRWILLGRESNRALAVPEEYVRRIPYEGIGSLAWVDELGKYLRNLAAAAKKGTGPRNIVFDGWSEFSAGFEIAYKAVHNPSNKFETWGQWREKFFETVQLLDPELLDANIFTTARVREFKEGQFDADTRKTTGRDPDWLEGLSYPAVDGWAKNNLGNYFNYIFYHEQGVKMASVGGKRVGTPTFRLHTLPAGEHLVKNISAHMWDGKAVMENTSWPDVQKIIAGG